MLLLFLFISLDLVCCVQNLRVKAGLQRLERLPALRRPTPGEDAHSWAITQQEAMDNTGRLHRMPSASADRSVAVR